MKYGVTEKNFNDTLRRGIFVENGSDLFPDGTKHELFLIMAKYGLPVRCRRGSV
jgi:hypothetical protein